MHFHSFGAPVGSRAAVAGAAPMGAAASHGAHATLRRDAPLPCSTSTSCAAAPESPSLQAVARQIYAPVSSASKPPTPASSATLAPPLDGCHGRGRADRARWVGTRPMGQSGRRAGPARKNFHRAGPGPPVRHDARHDTARNCRRA
jgi:hypothetical protein